MDVRSRHIVILLALAALLIGSCKQSKRRTQVIVQTWQGKQILMPNNVSFKTFERDTSCVSMLNKQFKILTYTDSIGCTVCKMRLLEWQKLIDTCTLYSFDVSFLFVVNTHNDDRLVNELFAINFGYPIIHDTNNEFDRQNHFPQEPYRTFLLDKDNKVLLIGSPVNNPKMWALYKKVILENSSTTI